MRYLGGITSGIVGRFIHSGRDFIKTFWKSQAFLPPPRGQAAFPTFAEHISGAKKNSERPILQDARKNSRRILSPT